MNEKCKLTVFTPTYNRKLLLKRCYESLKRQTSKEFKWLIIDDGSKDSTCDLVTKWIQETKEFEIRYIYKENGGLHTAYNEAISNIETELCVCIDSDDYMPDNAVEIILEFWKLNGSKEYAGIIGLDFDTNNQVIGDYLPKQKSVNLIDLLVGRYNIVNGDRTNVVRTDLYKSVAPMKVFADEKNFNPHYMHLQISKDYDFLVINENLRYVEYQENGMSNSILFQYKNSPNSFIETRKLYLSFENTPLIFRIRHIVHLISSCFILRDPKRAFRETENFLITIFAFPIGWLLYKYIEKNTQEK